jgi:NOL1/NOP2/fmu family ribosome biogenesis protein
MNMNKKRIIMMLSALTLVSTQTLADIQPEGKLTIDRDGIKVWTFKKSGNPIMNFRATTIIESTLSGAVALVMDTEHAAEWAPYTGKALVLDRDDQAGTFSLRMDLNFPFPLSNRDVVLTGHTSQTADGIVTIRNTSVEDPRAPVRPNFVRVQHYEGLWQFKPLGKTPSGKQLIEVTVSGFADPNGFLPLGIVNLFVQQQPFDMLRNMFNYVKAAKYQKAIVIGIKEMP